MIRITTAVPAAMMAAANELAACLGASPADRETFTTADWVDANGALYALASGLGAGLPATLPMPPWPVDYAAAQGARDALVVIDLGEAGETEGDDDPPPAAANPGRITAVITDEPDAAIAALGLSRIA